MASANDAAAPRRVHGSLLAAAEKRLLVALAARLPAWVTPDGLTAFGIAGSALVLAGCLLSNEHAAFLWLANLGLVVHWFGDSLDGTLARHRRIERPRYGFFVDQTIDVVGNLLIMLGVGLSPYARMDTALLALAGYHALGIYSLVRSAVMDEHKVSMAGFGPTEVRIILFAMNAGIFFGGARDGFLGLAHFSWCDVLMIAGFVAMALIFATGFIADARRLDREERGG